MNKLSIALLCGSLLLGLGGWMQTLASWGDATSPSTLAGLLLIVGGVIINWLNKSPLKDKQDGKA